MNKMLASDLNNPEFIGARNPDDLLHVEFYWNDPIDKNKSEELGKLVREQRTPFIRIMVPGQNNSILETPVEDRHKQRFPQKWIAWQMKEGLIDGGKDIPGWKIEDWTHLDDTQRRELNYLRFHTVELIAGASDAQVQRMGMGGVSLRENARHALREKMNAGVKEAMDAKDKMISDLAARLDALEAKNPKKEPKEAGAI